MPKRPRPFIVRIQAEGTAAEKNLERNDIQRKAEILASKMPTVQPDRQMYLRNLLNQTLQGKVDKEVFKAFVKLTNTYLDIEQIAPRAKLITSKRR